MANPVPPADESSLSLLGKYPVLILGALTVAVTAVLQALISVGLDIPEGSEDKISKAVYAVGFLVFLLLAWWRTTSSAKVINQVTNSGEVVAGEAAIEPTGSTVQLAEDPITRLPVPLSTVNPKLVTQDITVPADDVVGRDNMKGLDEGPTPGF